jgi:prolipoprotein diacylglyceryltransferase
LFSGWLKNGRRSGDSFRALIGERHLPAILAVAITAMIISALWAQVIEGSQKLLRPLGFYGGVLGIIAGCFLVDMVLGEDFFLIWASFAVAAPWIQGIGRLRCLIQGCCHGSPTTPDIGIRYFHERSRVVRLADLKGAYLHPAPVYSILANIVSGVFLLKLWFANAPSPFIIGMCFILNGLSRFVEEAYRGEPQTPVVRGLRLYQWIALSGIILGAILTTIPYSVSRPAVQFNAATLLIAVTGGLLATFLTGIDFPQSNKRFSRLV